METVIAAHGLARGGVVGHGDVVAQVQTDEGLIEGCRRHIPVGVVDAVRVRVVKIELRDGLTERDAFDAEDLGKHFFLSGGRVLASPDHFTQLPGILADKKSELIHEGLRVGGLVGLGHGALGHGAVFAHQIRCHTPVASVVEAVQDVFRHAVVLLSGRLRDCHLQDIVGFFEFVEESQVVAGELEFGQAGLFYHFFPHDVHRGKKPAASALLLGRDAVCLDLYLKRAGELRGVYRDKSEIGHSCAGHGGCQGLCVPVLSVKLVKAADLFVCDHGDKVSLFVDGGKWVK